MSGLRFAELFAGGGGLSMGLERAGWTCAWHAEWNDDARSVLSHHWPDVPLYGDVTTLDGRELTAAHGSIDLLSGGSPCQDLSVAGKRAGLAGGRSGLFYEQMRLWDESGADLCLWENVDGARSSNDGKDFGEVLRAFVGAAFAVPSDGWRSAGVAAGPTGVAAWRVLDAQFFGVPQRRRRVFVLGTRTGRVDPAEILSLAESLRGNSPPRRKAREGTAGDAGRRVAFALGSHAGAADGSVSNESHASGGRMGMGIGEELANSLRASLTQSVVAFHQTQDPISDEELSPAIGSTSSGMGVVAFDTTQVTHPENRCNPQLGDPCHPLAAGAHVPLVVPIQEVGKRTGTSTTDPRAGLGIGENGDPMYTLQASAQHGVVAFSPSQGGRSMPVDEIAPTLEAGTGNKAPAILAFNVKQDGADVDEIAPTLLAMPHDESHANGGGQLGVVCLTGEITHALTHEGHDASEDGTGRGTPVIIAHALKAADNCKHRADSEIYPVQSGIPRRLMPIECERLMSWPDDHTLVPNASGKLLSDSARYKICGNGVASVHTHWIGWRLALALDIA